MKRHRRKTGEKRSLTYAITPERETEIREYVESVHEKTKMPKGHIVSELLVEAVRRAKNFYPVNSDFSDNSVSNQ